MKPFVVPASTANAALGGAVTIIVTWAAKQCCGIEVPDYVAQAFTLIVMALLGHFTNDTPAAPVAREAVQDAADKADAAALVAKLDKPQ